MLGFDTLEFAVYSLILLNSKVTAQFLQAITFADAKRTFTKDILMRIDLFELAKIIDLQEVRRALNIFNTTYGFDLTMDTWDKFIDTMTPIKSRQLALFG